ncbi:unnamed protein product, partial [Nesidiocoris tenuis]
MKTGLKLTWRDMVRHRQGARQHWTVASDRSHFLPARNPSRNHFLNKCLWGPCSKSYAPRYARRIPTGSPCTSVVRRVPASGARFHCQEIPPRRFRRLNPWRTFAHNFVGRKEETSVSMADVVILLCRYCFARFSRETDIFPGSATGVRIHIRQYRNGRWLCVSYVFEGDSQTTGDFRDQNFLKNQLHPKNLKNIHPNLQYPNIYGLLERSVQEPSRTLPKIVEIGSVEANVQLGVSYIDHLVNFEPLNSWCNAPSENVFFFREHPIRLSYSFSTPAIVHKNPISTWTCSHHASVFLILSKFSHLNLLQKNWRFQAELVRVVYRAQMIILRFRGESIAHGPCRAKNAMPAPNSAYLNERGFQGRLSSVEDIVAHMHLIYFLASRLKCWRVDRLLCLGSAVNTALKLRDGVVEFNPGLRRQHGSIFYFRPPETLTRLPLSRTTTPSTEIIPLISQGIRIANQPLYTKPFSRSGARVSRSQDVSSPSKTADESEDEFFDCEDEETNSMGDQPNLGAPSISRKSSIADPVPQGRLEEHPTLKLLKTGQPLWIPITQGATPKTEDQLEEDAQTLIQLGSDAEASQLRAKIMSASLLSDMEAFKAANPRAVIEDFIRWYSPRDWIETDEEDEWNQKKGELSARMQLPGNTWLEVWGTARGVPAKRQKRLFDDTAEGEKALHFIESRSPAAAATSLLPVLMQAGLKRLEEEAASVLLPSLHLTIAHITKKIEVLSRQAPSDTRRFQTRPSRMSGCCTSTNITYLSSLYQRFLRPPRLCQLVVNSYLRGYKLTTKALMPADQNYQLTIFKERGRRARSGVVELGSWSFSILLIRNLFSPVPVTNFGLIAEHIELQEPSSSVHFHRLSVTGRSSVVAIIGIAGAEQQPVPFYWIFRGHSASWSFPRCTNYFQRLSPPISLYYIIETRTQICNKIFSPSAVR